MMIYNQLGKTDIKVSSICLGTMTWGEQNTEKEAHEQLSYAMDNEINFIDTAEMYAVPGKKETQGLTEKYIGTWLKNRADRDKIILASKAAGPQPWLTYLRGGPKFNKEHLTQAVNDSLARLQTDYLDLYQLHWPERKTNYFGKRGFVHDPEDPWEDNFHEILHVLSELIKSGKIRHIGISNETPWGMMRFLQLSEMHDLPRIVSIQNSYSLLNRTFEIGNAEITMREKVGLLAYSPLAFGLLTGKYGNGQLPENARLTLFPRMARYSSDNTRKAADEYVNIAKDAGLLPAQMALAYVNSRPFVTANIIGATTMTQLKENISSSKIELGQDIVEAIEKVHQLIPDPAP